MTVGLLIRLAVAADAGPLLVVQRSAYVSEAQRYGDPMIPPLLETLDEVRAAIAADGVLVATIDGRLVGSARGAVVDGVCHIGRISVADDLQGQGIGGRLLTAVEDWAPGCSSYTLFTGADSPHNIRLYERHGYTGDHTERFSERVTFLHMTRPAERG